MKFRKIISSLLATTMLATSFTALAASDIESNWAKSYITYLHEKEVMFPSGENFKPTNIISRAELMRYLNRAFNFTELGNVSTYTDLKEDSWYYEEVQKAVKQGYIKGTGSNTMNPLGTITREEVVTIMGRLHKSTPTGTVADLSFSDKASISSWSQGYISDSVKKGYVVGLPDGRFNPKGNITRAEIAKIIYMFMGGRVDTDDVYNSAVLRTDANNVTITTGAELQNTTINGELYITEGVMDKTVTLSNVNVKGDIIISGGDVILSDVNAENVIISSPTNKYITVTAQDDTNIANVNIQSDARIIEEDLYAGAGGFSDVTIKGENTIDATIDSDVWNVNVESKSDIDVISSTVDTVTFNASGNLNGKGTIYKAIINANGVNIGMVPQDYEIAKGITATINGNEVTSSTTFTVSPTSAIFDKYTKSSAGQYDDVNATLSVDTSELSYITCDGDKMTLKTDYTVSGNKVRFLKERLAKLSDGNHTIQFVTDSGAKAVFVLTVKDTSKNGIDISEVEFDKYSASQGYNDIKINITPAYGNTLKSIKVSGSTLQQGTDYTLSSNVVTLKKEYLAKKSQGTLTFTFEFTSNNSPTLVMTIKDSSPVNEVTPGTIKFNVNTSSSLYQDVEVKLSTVDGAELEDIKYGDKYLTPVQDYYQLDDGTVVLRKKALANLAGSNTSAELTFKMSKGEDPVLKIQYINTYNATFNVVDDLGNAVEGATITVADQSVKTDVNGQAILSLEKGTYTAAIKGNNFKTIEKEVKVTSYAVAVPVTVEKINTVSIYIENYLGKKISGATVTLDNASVATGVDGLAEFNIKSGTYTLKVTASGYTTHTETIYISDNVAKRIRLS